MTKFVTHVSIWFSSEGASPAVVIKRLVELGFTPVRGTYDFVYEHQNMSEKDLGNAILETANALHAALSGFKVLYNLDTYAEDENEDYIPLEDIDAELEATRKELSELESEIENR